MQVAEPALSMLRVSLEAAPTAGSCTRPLVTTQLRVSVMVCVGGVFK